MKTKHFDVGFEIKAVNADGTVVVEGGANGIRFGTGISLAITGAAGDLDTTAIAAGDVKVATSFT